MKSLCFYQYVKLTRERQIYVKRKMALPKSQCATNLQAGGNKFTNSIDDSYMLGGTPRHSLGNIGV